MFHLIVTITAKTRSDVAPVAEALARMRPLCLAEPGCLSWEAYQSLDTPSKFVLVEHWASRGHWDAHGELSAIKDIYMPEVFPRIEREVHPSKALGHPV
jgi:quinol monooxygenase YgiN